MFLPRMWTTENFKAKYEARILSIFLRSGKLRRRYRRRMEKPRISISKSGVIRDTQSHSVSFYASAAEKPRDLEFPLRTLKQELDNDGLQVVLDFALAVESKRRFSRAFSRSPTDRSISSTTTTTTSKRVFLLLLPKNQTDSTSAPSTFSHTQTGLSLSTAPTATTPRMSVASIGSYGQTDRSKGDLSTLESIAKQMRYLKIEFSNLDGKSIPFCAHSKNC
jgi:hypothetical protein